MVDFELLLTFQLWFTFESWVGGQTNAQTDTHINTMTWPGLRIQPSENTTKKLSKTI